MMHRCISPSTAAVICKQISDFGKCSIAGPGSIINCGSYASIAHLAPEVLSTGPASYAGDVYSFGVLLWGMCTGT